MDSSGAPHACCRQPAITFWAPFAANHPLTCVVCAAAGLSHSFRACATGNMGAPLLLPRAGPGGDGPLQLGLLTSGFSCSTDPAVASASSPALYTWLPRYAEWLDQQLKKAGGQAE